MAAEVTSSIEKLARRADVAEREVAKLTACVEEFAPYADDAKCEIARLRDAQGAGPAPTSVPPPEPEPPAELTPLLCAPGRTNFGLHEDEDQNSFLCGVVAHA